MVGHCPGKTEVLGSNPARGSFFLLQMHISRVLASMVAMATNAFFAAFWVIF